MQQGFSTRSRTDATTEKETDHRQQFYTRVPVTGFINLYEARNVVLIRFWKCILLVALISISYNSAKTVIKALNSEKVIYLRIHYDEDKLPFPNVSVCSPVVINRTYVREAITVPADFLNILQKRNRSLRAFMDDFSTYMAYSVRVKDLNAGELRYFDQLYALNFHYFDGKTNDTGPAVLKFYKDSQPSCPKLLTDCTFDDQPFDCCENVEFRMLEDGVCYTISTHSSNSESFSDRAQRRVSPTAGLTFRAAFDLQYASYIEADHAEGFQIHVDHVASYMGSPVTVPLGTSATLRLKGRNEVLGGHCLREITEKQTKALRWNHYYDPGGIHCKEERFLKLMIDLLNCNLPLAPSFETDKPVCTPRGMYALEKVLNTDFGDIESHYQEIDMERLRSTVRNAYCTDECLPACNDWQYDIFASYLSMIHAPTSNIEAEFSQISIFFDDLSYFQFVHKPAVHPYTLISDLGGIIVLYLGISMTAILQLTWYGLMWVLAESRQKVRQAAYTMSLRRPKIRPVDESRMMRDYRKFHSMRS